MALIARLTEQVEHISDDAGLENVKNALIDLVYDKLNPKIYALVELKNAALQKEKQKATALQRVSLKLTLASKTHSGTPEQWSEIVAQSYNDADLPSQLNPDQLRITRSIGVELEKEASKYQHDTNAKSTEHKQKDWDETVAQLYQKAGWPSPITEKVKGYRQSALGQWINMAYREMDDMDAAYVNNYAVAGLPPPLPHEFSLSTWTHKLSPI